jgi:methyl-accepting chemotaxis protein
MHVFDLDSHDFRNFQGGYELNQRLLYSCSKSNEGNKMDSIKMGPKLIGSYLLIVAMAVFVSIYLLYQLSEEKDSIELLYDGGVMSLNNMALSARVVNFMRITAYQAVLSDSKDKRLKLQKDMDSLKTVIDKIYVEETAKTNHEEDKKNISNVIRCLNEYQKTYYRFIANMNAGLSGEALLAELEAKATELVSHNRGYIVRRGEVAKQLEDHALEQYNSSRQSSIIILSFMALVAIAIGIYMMRSITKPLYSIVNLLKKAEEGDMCTRASLARTDEIGFVAKSVDSFFDEMQGVIKSIRTNSDTLAGASEELSVVSRQMAIGAEETVNQSTMVAGTTEQMSVNINAMASGAEEASANASEVAGAAEEMSVNMNTVASAIEEMSASINQIASNTSEVHKIATDATNEATEATNAMNKLGLAAKEIGQVTEVIKKIADKTNLLALNATIEAASAGEAGKGFAVVAGEIKELANQSAQSADDIARRIESIQNGTNDAVTVINKVSNIIVKINHSVESIASHVDQQTKASNEIASNVAQANTGAKRVAGAISDVAKGATDVSRNAGEAAMGADNVSQSAHGMNKAAKESAQGANQVNQSAGDLAQIAGELKQTVSRFKV